jgi:hypothetical protein
VALPAIVIRFRHRAVCTAFSQLTANL